MTALPLRVLRPRCTRRVLGGALLALGLSAASSVSAMAEAAVQPAAAAGQPAAPAVPAAQPAAPAAQPAAPAVPPVLEIRALDKITGHATILFAPLNKPVKYETLTIVARECYSTPPSEPPETSAFLQIEDHRPGQKPREAFSGWMYASSPGINGMEHPLYDVWVMKCRASAPDQATEPQTEVTVSPQDAAEDGDDAADESGTGAEAAADVPAAAAPGTGGDTSH